MKPCVCRMCGEKFKPAGEEHICAQFEQELWALELATPPAPTTEEEQETNAT